MKSTKQSDVDLLIPFLGHASRELFDRAPGKKEFVAIEGGGHNDLWAVHEDSMRGAVERFLASIR